MLFSKRHNKTSEYELFINPSQNGYLALRKTQENSVSKGLLEEGINKECCHKT